MAGYIRLQDPINVSSPQAQEREYAVDLGAYRYVTVQIRVLKAATSGTIHLEHSAVNEEGTFVLVGNIVNLNPAANIPFEITGLLRFLRWRVPTISGDATFLIDLVVRE